MAVSTTKEQFRLFLEKGSIPIFFQDWWLDAVCLSESWDVALSVNKDGDIMGVFPYLIKKKGLFDVSIMPPLTPFLGPYVVPFKGVKRVEAYSYYRKVVNGLIPAVKEVDYFAQKFSPEIKDWYPFYRNGYQQTTSYTYILDNIRNLEAAWDGMKNTVRTVIRKTEGNLSVVPLLEPSVLYRLVEETFSRQKLPVPYEEKVLHNIWDECRARDCGFMMQAQDSQGKTHAAIMIVRDESVAYNLVIGVSEEDKNSGAVQRLIWEAIKKSSESVDVFNFEGSMLPHIEPVFRHFGGELTPYFRISRDKNAFVKGVRNVLRK